MPNSRTTWRLKSLSSGNWTSSAAAKAVCARSLSTHMPSTLAPNASKRVWFSRNASSSAVQTRPKSNRYQARTTGPRLNWSARSTGLPVDDGKVNSGARSPTARLRLSGIAQSVRRTVVRGPGGRSLDADAGQTCPTADAADARLLGQCRPIGMARPEQRIDRANPFYTLMEEQRQHGPTARQQSSDCDRRRQWHRRRDRAPVLG